MFAKVSHSRNIMTQIESSEIASKKDFPILGNQNFFFNFDHFNLFFKVV